MPIVNIDGADMIDRAIAWHVRLPDATPEVWAAFVDWLEADPAHAAAYDRIAAADRALDARAFPAPAPLAGNDNDACAASPRRRGWWLAGGGAVAAGVAALLAITLLPTRADPYVVATAAGERRSVDLPDGSRIELSGGTRLRLDRAAPRFAALEAGEALFHVRHDPGAPFVVVADGRTVQDVGTVFNVASDGHHLSVAVAEGAVVYEPKGVAVRLNPGDALQATSGATNFVRSTVAPREVGGWREGVLTFTSEPLGEVAAALERLYGFHIILSPGLSARPFTGMVRFSGTADRDVPHLAELIGATWRRDKQGWVLAEGAGR
ncbi:FecR family protein [Sphingomonas floccifaciens]|uniref:FecR family protein n=1 Tax=Sphingomonas floccifaciens TaxID=1844115 RepID=A0ABW4NE84_9SPHN